MTVAERRAGRRVWITGIGLITAVGTGCDAFWAGLQRGTSAVKRIDRFDPGQFRSQVAAQVDDFEPTDYMDASSAREADRFSQFALAAGRMAINDARLQVGARGAPRADRFAVYIGSALGGIAYAEIQHERFMSRGIGAVAPNLAQALLGTTAPASLGIALGLHGPILSTANSSAAGTVALGEAFRIIRSGVADAALAGGVEAPLSPLAFGAFDIIGALSSGHNDTPGSAMRPFDSDRDGFVLGEGAALLVLESADVAQRRGATPYAELRGFGATSDAFDLVEPRTDGRQAARAARIALADAGMKAADVDYVNAHASSTHVGDAVEAAAIARALGARARTVPVSGTKAYYGHPLGASGAIEAAIAALAIRHGWAPGTVNMTAPDADVVAALPGLLAQPFQGTIKGVLSTSHGFGGLNAALAFSAPQ